MTIRKHCLFSCACVRMLWENIVNRECQDLILLIERFADGNADAAEVIELGKTLEAQLAFELCADRRFRPDWIAISCYWLVERSIRLESWSIARAVISSQWDHALADPQVKRSEKHKIGWQRMDAMEARLCDVVRDIREPFFDADLLISQLNTPIHQRCSPATKCRAREIYETGRLEEVRSLHDLLLTDGIMDHSILAHAKHKTNRHFRGCWLVDAILGL